MQGSRRQKYSRPMVILPSEAEIQKTCSHLLRLDGWRALRTDPVSDRLRGKGFGEAGMADYLYIRYAANDACKLTIASVELMWIEWKRRDGKAAKHQKTWHARERARGALTLIAGEDFPASPEGFASWYKQSGLQRKRLSVGAKSFSAPNPS